MTPEEYLEQLKTNIQMALEVEVYDEAEAEGYRLQGAEAMYLIFKKEKK